MTRMHITSIARLTIRTAGALALMAIARPATAQPSATPDAQPHWEFVMSNGRRVQSGAQRNVVADGNMTAAQVWYAVNPTVAVTGSLGWARSRDLVEAGLPKRDIFSYDLGAEFRSSRIAVSKAITIRPLAGAGFGGQTSADRGLDIAAAHRLSAYGSAGVEIGFGHVAFRVEGRDYVSGANRNDVAILTGIRFGVR